MTALPFPPGLIEALRNARRIAALTGAGVSAESGIPTFRQAQTGLWARYDPTELATPEAFHKDPRLVWEWYAWRRELVSQAAPNPGHLALARLERLAPEFTLISQNVDGLHARAGSRALIELHGNLNQARCTVEGITLPAPPLPAQGLPQCPGCGSALRPDVVWFGESLPQDALQQAQSAARNCQVFLSIGTSGVVQPAASLPFLAMEQGAYVVEINPNPTSLSGMAAAVLAGPSAQVLPALLIEAWGAAAAHPDPIP